MDLRLITPPIAEPIAIEDAQQHLRADVEGPDAALIEAYLQAAREAVERHTGRALMTQTWEVRFPEFAEYLVLPVPPVVSVTSVRYMTPDGVDTLMASSLYQTELPTGPTAQTGRIWPAPGEVWPTTRRNDRAAVTVRFQAGYASAATVPAALRSALLLVLGELYENREASVVKAPVEGPAIRRLLDPYKVFWL
jgi:uncharacterized phiE125 gp8 family phage protein